MSDIAGTVAETIAETKARVGDLDIAYRRRGAPDAPAMILIRGLGTQMIEWSPVLIDALVAGGLQVVIFDNRDVGASSKLTRSYELADMAADVAGLLDALRIERAHIFGISLGGMVAQLVAVRFPERVRSLISVMSSSGAPGLPTASADIRAAMVEQPQGRDAIIGHDAANRQLFGSPAYPETQAQRLAMAEAVYERCYCPEGVQRQLQAAVADGSRVERLKTISVPTLVIHGAEDPLLPPACGVDTARHIPGSELAIIAGMGHNIPDALAPELARRVLDFVARRGG